MFHCSYEIPCMSFDLHSGSFFCVCGDGGVVGVGVDVVFIMIEIALYGEQPVTFVPYKM